MGQPVVSNEMKLYLYYQNLSEWLCEDGKLEEALETVREMQACVERLRPLKGGAYPLQIPEKVFLSKEGGWTVGWQTSMCCWDRQEKAGNGSRRCGKIRW